MQAGWQALAEMKVAAGTAMLNVWSATHDEFRCRLIVNSSNCQFKPSHQPPATPHTCDACCPKRLHAKARIQPS